MDNKTREFLTKVFFIDGHISVIEQTALLRDVTDGFDKNCIKRLFGDIVQFYWENQEQYNEQLKSDSFVSYIPPIKKEDSPLEVISKIAFNNHDLKRIIRTIYDRIPMAPKILVSPVFIIDRELELTLEILKKINAWLNEPSIAEKNQTLLDKYRNLNLDAICEAYSQYEGLYNGNWVQLGDFPEEGDYISYNEDRKSALKILEGLYKLLAPYEQQINKDWEVVDGDLMSQPYIREKLHCLAMICRDYHNRIGFLKSITNTEDDNTSTPPKRTEIITPTNKKYFDRAVSKGYAIEEDGAYKWVQKKVKLGYFINEVFGKEHSDIIPYKAIESLFGEKRLDSTIDHCMTTKKPQKWRDTMDNDIFFD